MELPHEVYDDIYFETWLFSQHFFLTKCWRYVWQNKSQPFSIIELRSWNVYQKLIGFGRKNPSSRSHFLCSTSWVDSWYIPKLVTLHQQLVFLFIKNVWLLCTILCRSLIYSKLHKVYHTMTFYVISNFLGHMNA